MKVWIDGDGDVAWDDPNQPVIRYLEDYEFLDKLIDERRRYDFVCRWIVLK